ncbi:MAG: transposase [Acetobacteraceae bacterium]
MVVEVRAGLDDNGIARPRGSVRGDKVWVRAVFPANAHGERPAGPRGKWRAGHRGFREGRGARCTGRPAACEGEKKCASERGRARNERCVARESAEGPECTQDSNTRRLKTCWSPKSIAASRALPAPRIKLELYGRAKSGAFADHQKASAMSGDGGMPATAPGPHRASAMLLSVRELLVRPARTIGQCAARLRGRIGHRRATRRERSCPTAGRGRHRGGSEGAGGSQGGPGAARKRDRLDRGAAGCDRRQAESTAQGEPGELPAGGDPYVGPITALSFALRVDATQFRSARHFAAWLGLVPRERSTAGKQRLGKISRAGDERLRVLLVVGATAVVRHTKSDRPGGSAWLLKLLERKPRKLAAVASANKTARIIWAMLTSGEAYPPASAAA